MLNSHPWPRNNGDFKRYMVSSSKKSVYYLNVLEFQAIWCAKQELYSIVQLYRYGYAFTAQALARPILMFFLNLPKKWQFKTSRKFDQSINKYNNDVVMSR